MMSHSKVDERGGHKPSEVTWGDGHTEWDEEGKRWGKRFTRREARRESTRIVNEAVRAFYLDNEEECREQAQRDLEDDNYLPFEDDTWDDTGEVREEPGDDYAFDPDAFGYDWNYPGSLDPYPAHEDGPGDGSGSGMGLSTFPAKTGLPASPSDVSAQRAIEGKPEDGSQDGGDWMEGDF